MTVCLGNANHPIAKNIYIDDIAIVRFTDEVDKESLGICPVPLSEADAHTRITEIDKTFPIWRVTPEQSLPRALVRVPYYFSNGTTQEDANIYRLIPPTKP